MFKGDVLLTIHNFSKLKSLAYNAKIWSSLKFLLLQYNIFSFCKIGKNFHYHIKISKSTQVYCTVITLTFYKHTKSHSFLQYHFHAKWSLSLFQLKHKSQLKLLSEAFSDRNGHAPLKPFNIHKIWKVKENSFSGFWDSKINISELTIIYIYK